MRVAVFLRNANLGRPGSPTRAQFEQAFEVAGARAPRSFLTNGTLVFDAASMRRAAAITRGACAGLKASCGLVEPAFVRSLVHLAALVKRAPFLAIDASSVHACTVTFLSRGADVGQLPPHNTRNDVEIVEASATEVFALARKVGASTGNPNAFVERVLGRPASTRVWNTIVRLVATCSDAA